MFWIWITAVVWVVFYFRREIFALLVAQKELRRIKKKFPPPPKQAKKTRESEGWAIEEAIKVSGRQRIVAIGLPSAEQALDEALLHRTRLIIEAGNDLAKRAEAESAEMWLINPFGERYPVRDFAQIDGYGG